MMQADGDGTTGTAMASSMANPTWLIMSAYIPPSTSLRPRWPRSLYFPHFPQRDQNQKPASNTLLTLHVRAPQRLSYRRRSPSYPVLLHKHHIHPPLLHGAAVKVLHSPGHLQHRILPLSCHCTLSSRSVSITLILPSLTSVID